MTSRSPSSPGVDSAPESGMPSSSATVPVDGARDASGLRGPALGGPPATAYPPQPAAAAVKPSDHQVAAILVTVLACLPAGIVALVYSGQVDERWRAGDVAGAVQASRRALTWIIVGVAVMVAVSLVAIVVWWATIVAMVSIFPSFERVTRSTPF